MDQFENKTDEQVRQSQIAPRRVNRHAIVVAIVLFALIVIGMFTFSYLKKTELQVGIVTPQAQKPAAEVKYASITRVDAKHYFIDGLHTLVGEIPMPTPCDLLEADAVVAESSPEQIAIDFTVLNNAQFCTQVVTPQRFKVSAAASEEVTFQASFMGREVELNLIPAEEGEVPEDFELFIKG